MQLLIACKISLLFMLRNLDFIDVAAFVLRVVVAVLIDCFDMILAEVPSHNENYSRIIDSLFYNQYPDWILKGLGEVYKVM